MSIYDLAQQARLEQEERDRQAKSEAVQAENERQLQGMQRLAERIGSAFRGLDDHGVIIRYVWHQNHPNVVLQVPPHPDHPDIELPLLRVKPDEYQSDIYRLYGFNSVGGEISLGEHKDIETLRQAILIAIATCVPEFINGTIAKRIRNAHQVREDAVRAQRQKAIEAEHFLCQSEVAGIIGSTLKQLPVFPPTVKVYKVTWDIGEYTESAWSLTAQPDADSFWNFIGEKNRTAARQRIELSSDRTLLVTETIFSSLDEMPYELKDDLHLMLPGYIAHRDNGVVGDSYAWRKVDEANSGFTRPIGTFPVRAILAAYATPEQLAAYDQINADREGTQQAEEVFPF